MRRRFVVDLVAIPGMGAFYKEVGRHETIGIYESCNYEEAQANAQRHDHPLFIETMKMDQ